MILKPYLSYSSRHLSLLFLLLAITLTLFGCGERVAKFPAIARGSTVLALGDSLTAGYGATPETAYPARLASATGWNVINGGVSGNTSAQALARLPALLKEHQPRLVLISIGGNDFLRHVPESETRANIDKIIQLSRAEGADVLLIGVPTLSAAAIAGFPDDHALYGDIAKREGIQLYSGGWTAVLKKPALRSDQIHPNATGYGEFTQQFVEFLRKSGRLP